MSDGCAGDKAMLNDNDYIGIPYKRLCDTHEQADCFGLVKLYYREHGWDTNFSDNKPVTYEQTQASQMIRVLRYLRKNFDETKNPDELEYGDIMLFMIDGDGHLGIMLDYGDILSAQVPSIEGKAFSTVYHRGWWTPFFKRGFKRRKK